MTPIRLPAANIPKLGAKVSRAGSLPDHMPSAGHAVGTEIVMAMGRLPWAIIMKSLLWEEAVVFVFLTCICMCQIALALGKLTACVMGQGKQFLKNTKTDYICLFLFRKWMN